MSGDCAKIRRADVKHHDKNGSQNFGIAIESPNTRLMGENHGHVSQSRKKLPPFGRGDKKYNLKLLDMQALAFQSLQKNLYEPCKPGLPRRNSFGFYGLLDSR